jgi:hypothetical protein
MSDGGAPGVFRHEFCEHFPLGCMENFGDRTDLFMGVDQLLSRG